MNPHSSRPQGAADGLDPETIAVFVDERDHLVVGRSSSAAKKAEALRRISFARRSSRFSLRSLVISSASVVLRPGAWPWSMRSCFHQLRFGVGRDPAESLADCGAGDPSRALFRADAFFDELQGTGLELGAVLLGHDPILLEEVGRNETQGASEYRAARPTPASRSSDQPGPAPSAARPPETCPGVRRRGCPHHHAGWPVAPILCGRDTAGMPHRHRRRQAHLGPVHPGHRGIVGHRDDAARADRAPMRHRAPHFGGVRGAVENHPD